MNEGKILKTIYITIIVIFLILSIVTSIFFVKGKVSIYNEEITKYKEDINTDYMFTNMELLDFFTVSDIEEYKKSFERLVENEAITGFDKVTILDSIAKSVDGEQYEWLSVCNNEKTNVFVSKYDKANKYYSVLLYTDENANDFDLSEEEKQMIKDAAGQNDKNYIDGGIENISEVKAVIKNRSDIEKVVSKNKMTAFDDKLLTFLNETSNHRREFTASDIKSSGNNVTFKLTASVELDTNNIINGTFNKDKGIFVFEYAK